VVQFGGVRLTGKTKEVSHTQREREREREREGEGEVERD
jgi:hypothetical protein